MLEHTVPEILRVALEDLVLQIKLLELGAEEGCPYRFLAKAIEPPPRNSVAQAIRALKNVNALVDIPAKVLMQRMSLADGEF
jgi:HrpA-like RNA helicase